MSARGPLASAVAIAVAFLASGPAHGAAGATTGISEPRGNPYRVELSAGGEPAPFTIAVSGFPPGSLVYVEQCDAQPANAPDWQPTRNCDIGTSPAAAIVDAEGNARFDAADRNHSFRPFVGPGPEALFNCLPQGAASPKNGLPDYRSCQIRVASNNTRTTADQVFLPIVFEAASASSSTSSRPVAALVALAVIPALALAGVVTVVRRRRATRST